MTTQLEEAPVATHNDVDRLVTMAVLGTLLSVQKRAFDMTKPQFDRWIEGEINYISSQL